MFQTRRPMNMDPGMRSGAKARLLIAGVLILFAVISYMSKRTVNPITGDTQYVSLTEKQEIAMGLQALPQMLQQNGGEYADQQLQDYLDRVGMLLVQSNPKVRDTEWRFDFHLLDNPEVINAFALPGGQVFITTALYGRLDTEGQLAAVLGHEIGHVVARHGAQRIAKQELTQGVAGAVVVAAGNSSASQVAQMIGNLVNMKYGREDELQSDTLGVQLMVDAGYDPRAMIGVQEILKSSRKGNEPPEFFSTHPSPDNRIEKIQAEIDTVFPNGVPEGLKP